MKTLLRCCFAGLIALGLTSQAARGRRQDVAEDKLAVVADRLARLNVNVEQPDSSEIIVGRSPLCAEPLLVTLMSADGADDGKLQSFLQPDRVGTFVYLGVVEDHPAKADLTARRAWATIRFVLGLRPDRPPARMAALALPYACPELRAADWSTLWP